MHAFDRVSKSSFREQKKMASVLPCNRSSSSNQAAGTAGTAGTAGPRHSSGAVSAMETPAMSLMPSLPARELQLGHCVREK